MGSVRAVVLDASAYYACLTHAFSNDQEEVMGLCIGDVNETVSELTLMDSVWYDLSY